MSGKKQILDVQHIHMRFNSKGVCVRAVTDVSFTVDEGETIGIVLNPDDIHIMRKSQYSDMFGDYSSYSEEYEELEDATLGVEEEPQEGGDEK